MKRLSKKELELRKLIQTEEKIIVLTPEARLIMASIMLQMSLEGKVVKARLEKGY